MDYCLHYDVAVGGGRGEVGGARWGWFFSPSYNQVLLIGIISRDCYAPWD